jgi:hypothetical protein
MVQMICLHFAKPKCGTPDWSYVDPRFYVGNEHVGVMRMNAFFARKMYSVCVRLGRKLW